MDFFKGMTYNDIRSISEKHYNFIRAFLKKGEKEIEEEGSKRKSDSLNHDAAKKQRINEEEEELKAHLQIVVNDDDEDVFTEATPLASKIWISKSQELEAIRILWSSYHNTHNYLDDFASRKEIPFDTLHSGINVNNMILLVEKRYPLTHFTLEQMLNNVRLEVEEESEMSLELLRLMRRQLIMVALAVSISTDSPDESFGDTIEISVDVTHPLPVTLAVFPVLTIVMRIAQHG
nr:hypothetical protein [Tanacetum cinerariifolium]